MVGFYVTAFAALVAVSCGEDRAASPSRAQGPDDAAVPAPPNLALNAVHIELRVDGQPLETIDLAARHDPSLWDRARIAWTVESVIGAAYRTRGSVFAVTASGGRHLLRAGEAESEGEPVLVVRESGTAYVSRLRPDPGQYAWRLADAEAPGTRVDDVVALEVVELPEMSLRIQDKMVLRQLDRDKLEAVATIRVGSRPAIRLRDLVKTYIADGVRVQDVSSAEKTVAISRRSWRDSRREPVLRITRKSQLKLIWVSPELEPIDGPQLRNVTSLKVVPDR